MLSPTLWCHQPYDVTNITVAYPDGSSTHTFAKYPISQGPYLLIAFELSLSILRKFEIIPFFEKWVLSAYEIPAFLVSHLIKFSAIFNQTYLFEFLLWDHFSLKWWYFSGHNLSYASYKWLFKKWVSDPIWYPFRSIQIRSELFRSVTFGASNILWHLRFSVTYYLTVRLH